MSEKAYESIGDELVKSKGVVISQLFGKPCLKSDGKAFACYFSGDMVFKVGRETADKLKDKFPGSVNFDPSGKNRPMKDWLQVPDTFSKDWLKLAKTALEFMGD